MAKKVLSVDIGPSYTKVCEVDYPSKNPKVYHNFILKTPDEMVADGFLTIDPEFVTAFKGKLAELGIKTKKVIFTVASSRIAIKETKIPYCKPNRIIDVVRANLEDYFPVDASKYLISHSILAKEVEALDENAKRGAVPKPSGYKLMLLAAPRQLLDGYKELANQLGLELITTDYSGNSIYQAARSICQDGVKLVVRIDGQMTSLIVLKNGVIDLNRSIPYGVDEGILALLEKQSFHGDDGYEKVLRLLRKNNYLQGEEEEGGEEDEGIAGAFRSLIDGIAKVIDYYNSNHTDAIIENMYLTGIGSDIIGMATLLEDSFGFPVDVLDKINGNDIDKHLPKECRGEFTTCIGAVIAPLSFYADHEEAGKRSKSSSVDPRRLAILICGGCTIIGLALVLSSVFPYLQQKKQKKQYEQIISELQPVYDTYLSYMQEKGQLDQVKALDGMTVNRNEELLSLIQTLERNMPASFRLNSLNADTQTVTLDVTVVTKEEVAVVLSELKKLPSFTQTDTTSISEVTNEIGETQYSFTVEMIYAPIETETEEETVQ